jgi:hypothetical protein
MRFCALHLLDLESPCYFGLHFYLDYMVTWLTTHGSRSHKHTHRYVCLCVCVVQNGVFFHVFVQVYNPITERFYLTSLTFLAFLNAA